MFSKYFSPTTSFAQALVEAHRLASKMGHAWARSTSPAEVYGLIPQEAIPGTVVRLIEALTSARDEEQWGGIYAPTLKVESWGGWCFEHTSQSGRISWRIDDTATWVDVNRPAGRVLQFRKAHDDTKWVQQYCDTQPGREVEARHVWAAMGVLGEHVLPDIKTTEAPHGWEKYFVLENESRTTTVAIRPKVPTEVAVAKGIYSDDEEEA